MDMNTLAAMSRWLLANPELRHRWGHEVWSEAFEACGSPGEWAEFWQRPKPAQLQLELRVQFERSAREVVLHRRARSRAVPA